MQNRIFSLIQKEIQTPGRILSSKRDTNAAATKPNSSAWNIEKPNNKKPITSITISPNDWNIKILSPP